MENNKKSPKLTAISVYFQIIIMIGMTFSFAYFLHESSSSRNKVDYAEQHDISEISDKLLSALNLFNKIVFSDNFVSALIQSDLSQGVYTCPRNKNGAICQEYAASTCREQCAVDCLPTSANASSICKLGTCYDTLEGTCQVNAPKARCEQFNGQWYDDAYGNANVCKPGCCILGDNAYFGTKQQCDRDSLVLGLKKDFRAEIKTELACLLLSKNQEEGACVFEREFENTCKFTTKTNCLQNMKGKFYSGILCSNPDLKTNCVAQKKISCLEGKDEVYWFDSCGNRENIYDVNKVKSLNLGRVLSKNESCSLSSGSNFFANQGTCGNCNYILGSVCGASNSNEKLSGVKADVVCKELSCIDESGKKRKNGESWCAYQGSTGTDKGVGGFLRGTDTAGSRDFRKVCIDGSIRTEPCADFRNEICIQSDTKVSDGTFSTAACRINRGYQCYEYNKPEKKDLCLKNPDCFIKHVEVDKKGFTFDICAPKYAPGFDLSERSEGSSAICSLASQKCQVVYVKGIGGWDCKANCNCEKAAFAEQMNDLCISLGDCGSKVNYIGDLSINHAIFKSKKKNEIGKEIGGAKAKLSNQYINGLVKYADEKLFKNKFIDAGNLTEFYGSLGIPGWLGTASGAGQDPTAEMRGVISQTAGMIGIAIPVAAYITGYAFLSSAGISTASLGISEGIGIGNAAMGPTVAAAGGAISGAAIGLAVVSFLLDITGVGRGLPPFVTYSLMAVGTIAGGIIGANIAVGGATFGSFSAGPLMAAAAAAWIAIVVVIIVIIVLSLIGVGDVKKIYYNFQCQPWQAPTGGTKCGQCGNDGFPCSKYSCQSLGQTCQLINEETGKAECVSVSENDASAPVITPISSTLPIGYSTEINGNGIKIKTSGNDGCVSNIYENAILGLSINEHAQCKMSNEHTAGFDEMEQSLDSGLFLKNHSLSLNIPSLEEVGLESFNPNAKAEYNIYLRCQDKNGNKNVNEFVVNYCIKPGEDKTAPIIIDREPFLETIRSNSNSLNASVFTNEPADCRWDDTDKLYGAMRNNFTCYNDFEQRVFGLWGSGWRCSGELPTPIGKNDFSYFVRCADQPHLTGENETKRNTNVEGYEFKLKRSLNALNIDSINVDNQNLSFSTEPVSVQVIVKTSGGLDGSARCGYRWGNSTIDFFETWKREHKQTFQSLFGGNIVLPIVCEDLIGNRAEKTAHFNIKIDYDAPEVTKVYVQSGTLNIITNEPAECYYSYSRIEECLFNIENASSMSGSEYEHSVEFDSGKRHYIKCKDTFNHVKGDCNIIIKEGKYETQQL